MCRLWGFSMGATPEDASPAELASVAFPALTPGGIHAYGWLTSQGEPGTVKVTKYAGRADTPAAQKNIAKMDPAATILIAHTRYATHGSPLNLDNDHPVRHENIVGVHNGVIRNYNEVLKQTGRWVQKSGAVSEVDSEAIFAAVNRWGHSRGLRKINGDMVAVYMDLRTPHLVTIGRSHGRPVHLGWTDKDNLFWASERQALTRLENHGVKFMAFSGMRDYRVLTIKGGNIVFRYTYRDTPAQVHPLRFDPSKYLPAPQGRPVRLPAAPRKASEPARSIPAPTYGVGWEGTAMAAPRATQAVDERNGPALTAYLRSIEEGHRTRAEVIAAAAEMALVEKRTPIGEDEGDERYFYNGRWMEADDFINAIADEEGWGDD